MAATAAHLVENVLPIVPVRQWVISFPLRIRHYLLDHNILQDVLDIVVDEIRKRIIACSADLPNPRIDAISFYQNFGSTLNVHPHFHLLFADGIFYLKESQLCFYETILSQDNVSYT